MEPVTIAVVGAGLRGQQYARLAEASGRGRVVAVAEPDQGLSSVTVSGPQTIRIPAPADAQRPGRRQHIPLVRRRH